MTTCIYLSIDLSTHLSNELTNYLSIYQLINQSIHSLDYNLSDPRSNRSKYYIISHCFYAPHSWLTLIYVNTYNSTAVLAWLHTLFSLMVVDVLDLNMTMMIIRIVMLVRKCWWWSRWWWWWSGWWY